MFDNLSKLNLKTLPKKQLILAVIFDLLDYTGWGYFASIPFDIYAYFWARKYTKNNIRKQSRKSLGKTLENSYVLRLILEYVPFINFLPISTFFVLSVWYENENKSD
jgi:hypothetical protein